MKRFNFTDFCLAAKITILNTIVIFVTLVISGAFSILLELPFSAYRKS